MKNPWMSMWLSAANKAAGAARGFGTAELHRQQKAIRDRAGHGSRAVDLQEASPRKAAERSGFIARSGGGPVSRSGLLPSIVL
jgi:hypothetical protein